MNQRELFLRHVGQTSTAPLALEISRASGCSLFDVAGKEYIDLIGGISVANTGHGHPTVIDAIKQQLDAYLHVMVYGEVIQSPQVQYAKLLADHLPAEPMSGKPWTRIETAHASFPSQMFAISSPSMPDPLPNGPVFFLDTADVTLRISWMEFQGSRDDSMPCDPDVIEIAFWPGASRLNS